MVFLHNFAFLKHRFLASDYAQLPADAVLFLSIRVPQAHVVTATAKVTYLPAGNCPKWRASDESSGLHWLAKYFAVGSMRVKLWADSEDKTEFLLAGIHDCGWPEVVHRRRRGQS